MGFSITSAVFGGIIIIMFGARIAITPGSCEGQCFCSGYGCANVTCEFQPFYRNDSYNTEMGLAAMILALGIIEFGTGICVAICLCMMRPCCTDLEVFPLPPYSSPFFASWKDANSHFMPYKK